MSIRQRRRERARRRIARQEAAEAAVEKLCKRDFNFAMDTFSGTVCPDCKKPVPARALFSTTGWYGTIHLIGCGVHPQFCHRDRRRCLAEAQAYWGKRYSEYFPECLEMLSKS